MHDKKQLATHDSRGRGAPAYGGGHSPEWLALIGGLPAAPGERGEERIARLLASLGPQWTRIHDRLLGPAWNLDHLLVGPPGVIALHAKDVRGDVWISGDTCLAGGEPTSFIRQARRDGLEVRLRLEAATGLELWVEPVIVFAQPDRLEIERAPWGATALRDDELLEWLRALPPAEDGPMQEILARAARCDATWH